MDKNSDRPNRMVWPAIVAIYQGAVWGGLFGLLMWYEPAQERIYHDFKMAIPEITRSFVSLAHLLRDYWVMAIIALVAWMALNFAVARLLDRRRSAAVSYCWYLTTALVPLAFLVLGAMAFILALMNIPLPR